MLTSIAMVICFIFVLFALMGAIAMIVWGIVDGIRSRSVGRTLIYLALAVFTASVFYLAHVGVL